MNRVAGLVLAGLVLLLNVTLTQAQAMCPVDGTEPSVPCDFTGTDNCFHHCCQTSGVCPSFSCISSFDAPTDEGTACTGKCRREIECVPFNSACLDDVNNPVCFGTVVCKTLDCAGRTAGDICLISGRKIKICGPLDDGGACTPIPGLPECSDGCDNDNDTRVDGDDIECTGAIDNDESSFSTGIPGDNRDTVMQDCFFDGNSGSSDDDGCEIHVCCLLGASDVASCPIGADQYIPAECAQPQAQMCQTYCEALTPPGCDCFGCCTVCDPATNTCFNIITNPATAPNCDETSISDPTKCPRCSKSESCEVPCGGGVCVLCPGQDPSDLPSTCTGGAECPAGQATCHADNACPSGQFCANNCCIDGIP